MRVFRKKREHAPQWEDKTTEADDGWYALEIELVGKGVRVEGRAQTIKETAKDLLKWLNQNNKGNFYTIAINGSDKFEFRSMRRDQIVGVRLYVRKGGKEEVEEVVEKEN